jgi:hypothetical protein
MRTVKVYRLCEPYLLRAQLPWHSKAELRIVPAIIKSSSSSCVTVGGRCLIFKRCCRIGDNLRVLLLPAFGDGDQIGSGEALRAVFGLGLCDELVSDTRLGEIGVISFSLGDDLETATVSSLLEGIGEEGEVCVNELLERHEPWNALLW